MNFLGMGVGELLLIMIIAAMVVGPERMVGLSRSAGKLLGKLRRETDAVTKEFREAISTFDDVGDIANETKAALKDITTEVKQAGRDAQSAVSEVKQIANETKAAAITAGTVGATTVAATSIRPSVPTSTAPAARTTPPTVTANATRSVTPAPPQPSVARPAVTALLDGEVAVPTPAVARGSLPIDEPTTVMLADLVPENPADAEPVEVQLPTLMVELADLAQEPEPPAKPKARARTRTKPPAAPVEPQNAPVEGDSAGSQG